MARGKKEVSTVKNEFLGRKYPEEQAGYEFIITTSKKSGFEHGDSRPFGCDYKEGAFHPAIIVWGPDFVGGKSSLGGAQIAFCALFGGEITIVGGRCQNETCSDHKSE